MIVYVEQFDLPYRLFGSVKIKKPDLIRLLDII